MNDGAEQPSERDCQDGGVGCPRPGLRGHDARVNQRRRTATIYRPTRRDRPTADGFDPDKIPVPGDIEGITCLREGVSRGREDAGDVS